MSVNSDTKMDKSRFKVEGYPVKHKAKIPFNPLVSLNVDLRAKIAVIESLDRKLGGFLLSGEDYMELAREVYALNIHWSTKIEGSRVSMDEVRELARRYTFGDLRESPNGPT